MYNRAIPWFCLNWMASRLAFPEGKHGFLTGTLFHFWTFFVVENEFPLPSISQLSVFFLPRNSKKPSKVLRAPLCDLQDTWLLWEITWLSSCNEVWIMLGPVLPKLSGNSPFISGFLLDFISYPVIRGFTSAAAVTIGFNQVKVGSSLPQLAFVLTAQVVWAQFY